MSCHFTRHVTIKENKVISLVQPSGEEPVLLRLQPVLAGGLAAGQPRGDLRGEVRRPQDAAQEESRDAVQESTRVLKRSEEIIMCTYLSLHNDGVLFYFFSLLCFFL